MMALCHKLHDTPRVAVFALLKAQAATLCLQSDLWMLAARCFHISFQQQQEYLNSCPPDSLLVVFSYTGSYFSYFPPLPPRDKRPFVAMIVGTPHPKKIRRAQRQIYMCHLLPPGRRCTTRGSSYR